MPDLYYICNIYIQLDVRGKGERTKKMLKRGEKRNTYLTHVCRLLQSLEKVEKKILSFSQYCGFHWLQNDTKVMLAGAARGVVGRREVGREAG